jgi:CRISPR type III-A-associated protein Csm2
MSEMEANDLQQAPPSEPAAGTPPVAETPAAAPAAAVPAEAPEAPAPVTEVPSTEAPAPEAKPRGERPPREPRPPRENKNGDNKGGQPKGNGPRPQPQPGERRGGSQQGPSQGKGRGEGAPGGGARDSRGPRPERGGRAEGPIEINLESLVNDSLYLDNAAHAVVARMRDMDAGTRSQLRRLYSAVRRACRAAEADRQHQFVMLRARLAYTIARHQLRSLDVLEKLLLQVTRRNEARSYERFRDLFEAIVAYNE